MEMVMRSEFVLFCLLLAPYLFASSIFSAADSASDALAQQCANELLTKLSPCLDYSTGKAELPTKECCTSVTSMRDQHPVCLCFLIQQTHNGRPEVKQLGLKEDRLLKISGTCKLTNASISECPRLLNLPRDSPDNAIFLNSTSNSSSTSSLSDTSNTTSATTMPSIGFMHGPQLAVPSAIALVIIAVFTGLFPTGYVS
ncbi:PREDICTED: non-specific lipid transfer protein GPI-anchored 1-like [Nelumbo nucifera]|uniref:Non-specific lipid transfer protein GPI-anchored 1-like n=1 Tax=Nelumbo nucifera TaxID=4432 RepID=A0A1U7ZB03_NELNU|nr:PREDICTED: non-specific lipid transfer protein GPI-anchored 1-like [Nelumbo nucifera]